ncbi:MAG TPA: PHP domain-containing protein [Cellvibrionaceae bacterium]|nr:PHP domain-containing protein [Cellvibrionaceae bacterium]
MIYDLHTHSNASDGFLSPADLVARAQAKGVNALALTDHDPLAGFSQAAAAAQQADISLIPGIEFSTQWLGRSIHIVGLGFNPAAASITQGIKRQATSRLERAQTIGEKLAKAGVPDAYAGAQALAGDAVLGRPHFAQYLVACGAVKDVASAFKRYLGAGKMGDVKQLWPGVEEAVEWITAAQGVAVLAHPDKYDMTRSKLCQLLGQFREAGGQALEVISGKQVNTLTDKLARLAGQFSLAASCGSDFHVPNQPWQELGAFGKLPDFCQPVWQLLPGHLSS